MSSSVIKRLLLVLGLLLAVVAAWPLLGTPDPSLLRTGPLVTATTQGLTISLQTREPAIVSLNVAGERICNPQAGTKHVLRAGGLSANTVYEYTVTLEAPRTGEVITLGPHRVRTLPESDSFRLAIAGDSRDGESTWKQIARAVHAQHPAIFIHGGDMVRDGRERDQWDTQFWEPAKVLLAEVPTLAVIGNHESQSPTFLELIQTPGGQTNWLQRIGPLLIVGIEGEGQWEPGSPNHLWLDRALGGSTSRYVLLVSHYPPLSSAAHGDVSAMEHVWALAARHDVSAIVTGHDHVYERVEKPGRPVVIISGGAGSPLHKKRQHIAESKVFERTHHYLLVDVSPTQMGIRAVTLDDREVDRIALGPRPGSSRPTSLPSTRETVIEAKP